MIKKAKRPIPNSYIVILEDGVDPMAEMLPAASRRRNIKNIADDLAARHGGRVDHVYETALKGFSVDISPERAEALSRDPRVKYVEENFEVYGIETQSDVSWGIDRIDERTMPLDSYYSYLTTGTGVHAYVIDSGIRSSHAEFGGRVSFGADFVTAGGTGADCNGHGTHVAGTLGGATHGVAKNVSLHNVRVLGCDNRGTGANILAGINWVTNNRVLPAVANFSIGMDGISTAVESAIASSIASGVSYALAAGNDNKDACTASPGGRVPTALAVGALAGNDGRAGFSNYGSCLDIFAPGAGVLSAWYTSDTAAGYLSGTSMAAPHVAGAIARLLEASPTSSPVDIKNFLINSATTGVMFNDGTGSPDRVLYIDPGFVPPPPPKIIMTPSANITMSALTVSNINGVISRTPGSVRLRLNGFSHTYPADVGLLLVSPAGISFAVQGSTGGTAPVSRRNYSISDAGLELIPVDGISEGAEYKPTVRNNPLGLVQPFPPPNNPGPAAGGSATFASTFGDLNPNGEWRLYVRDLNTHQDDRGSMLDWSLEFDAAPIPPDPTQTPPAGGAAGFVGYDSFTRGRWFERYGSEAWALYCTSAQESPWVKLIQSDTSTPLRCHSPLPGDDRAFLRLPTSTDRTLGELYSPSQFDMRFEATDSRSHRLALYFVDYLGMGREQKIEMFDTDTGNLIDTRTLINFTGGKYLIWQLRGRVTVRITKTAGPDAVLNGFFIDPLPPNAPVPPPDENTVGRFIGFDTSTQGNWVGTYGAEGQVISYDTAQKLGTWAGYQRFGASSGFSYRKWADPSTDVRSLQKSAAPSERIGAEFYHTGSKDVGLAFNFTDGKAHQLGIYFWAHWGTPGQTYRLEIVDVNGNVVDRQLVTGMESGVYAKWRVKGKFTLWITNLGPGNDIIFGGIFLDPVDGNPAAPTPRINYALTGNGGFATASSTASGFSQWSAIDGYRSGVNFGSTSFVDSGWKDNTQDVFPDWLRVDFSTPKLVDEINVFTLRDNNLVSENPTEFTTFSQSGITDFEVQYWDGTTWHTVPGGSVTGNNKVWRKFTFAPIPMRGIRVQVNNALAGSSRIVELEAWTGREPAPSPLPPAPTPTPTPTPTPANIPPVANDDSVTINQNSDLITIDVLANDFDPDGSSFGITNVTQGLNGSVGGTSKSVQYYPNPGFSGVDTFTYTIMDARNGTDTATVTVTVNPMTNFALASNGATATASSQLSTGFPTASVINGDRKGLNWGSGGGWNDNTQGAYPDWVEVNFAANRSIDEVNVFTLQDNYQSPVDPHLGTTFSNYGILSFDVQYWSGSSWLTVPNGKITFNNKVWTKVKFPTLTTSKIRVLVNGALLDYSRIVEVEAWGPSAGPAPTPTPTPSPTPTPTPTPIPTPTPTATPAPGIRTNHALASNGAGVTVSSLYSAAFPNSSLTNGDRKGVNWGNGGGWNDATSNAYPDWAEITFDGVETIDEVNVFTLQDNYGSPLEPTLDMTFNSYGVLDFDVQYWTGSAWQTVPGGSVTGNNRAWRKFTFSPIATQKIRIYVTNSQAGHTRLVEIEAWGGSVVPTPTPTPDPTPDPSPSQTPAPTPTPTATPAPNPTPTPVQRTNYALAAEGGAASASSQHSSAFPVSAVNNGDRKGTGWGSGGGWNDATSNNYPDWVEVAFNGTKSIDEVDVFTIQDNYSNPSEPDLSSTFTSYGVTDIEVQYWTGAAWQPVTNGSASGNNKVWRQFTFAPVDTSKIRVLVNAALASHSRLAEVEAWGGAASPTPTPTPPTTPAPTPGSRSNVALALNGAVASASSTHSSGFAPATAINGDRRGNGWGSDGGWNDNTSGSYPDWLEVAFSGTRTVDEIDLFTLQDNYAAPAAPTEQMTFSQYGVTAFEAQYWNGSGWVTVPGGSVTGNSNVWRRFTFPAVQTTKIRVLVNSSMGGYSRIAEIEAWGT